MEEQKNLYETVFVLHPELTDEDVEATIATIESVLRDKGADILRIERGGKRRLAYPIRKQRYGYYTLMHFRCMPPALSELERTYRLSDRVIRHLTVRFEKEDQLTGFTRLADDDGRDEDRDDRRRGPRRGDSFGPRSAPRGRRVPEVAAMDDDDDVGDEPETASVTSVDEDGDEAASVEER